MATCFFLTAKGREGGTRSPLASRGGARGDAETETMNIEFIEALEEMAKDKGIPREDLYAAIRKGLAAAFAEERGLGEDEEIDVVIDQHSGDITIRGQRIDLAKFGRIATKKAEETIRQEIVQRRREIVHNLFARASARSSVARSTVSKGRASGSTSAKRRRSCPRPSGSRASDTTPVRGCARTS